MLDRFPDEAHDTVSVIVHKLVDEWLKKTCNCNHLPEHADAVSLEDHHQNCQVVQQLRDFQGRFEGPADSVKERLAELSDDEAEAEAQELERKLKFINEARAARKAKNAPEASSKGAPKTPAPPANKDGKVSEDKK